MSLLFLLMLIRVSDMIKGELAVEFMFTDFYKILIFDLLKRKTFIQTIKILK